jgi:thymidine phosphorylase
MTEMVVPRLIERKRDGQALAPGDWRRLIGAYVKGEVPDYQMAAMAMAVMFRGLSAAELQELVDAMLMSGDRLDFSGWTSTQSAGWATRPRCCLPRCSPAVAWPFP